MDSACLTPEQQVQVAERVTFLDGSRAVSGYVARQGHTYAYIVTDDGTEVRVPYRLLSRVLGTPRKHMQSRTDTLRAQFHAGDRVRFAVGAEGLHGTISRVNPTYAHVVCEDTRAYRVPYAHLATQACRADTAPRSPQRTDGELQAIAARATAWIAAHQLEGWSFQFDHATKRAGCCNYRTQVISLAHAYARAAPDEAIDDTLLHEIAHALVGKAHGHDQVWQAQAVALGCAGPTLSRRAVHATALHRHVRQCVLGHHRRAAAAGRRVPHVSWPGVLEDLHGSTLAGSLTTAGHIGSASAPPSDMIVASTALGLRRTPEG